MLIFIFIFVVLIFKFIIISHITIFLKLQEWMHWFLVIIWRGPLLIIAWCFIIPVCILICLLCYIYHAHLMIDAIHERNDDCSQGKDRSEETWKKLENWVEPRPTTIADIHFFLKEIYENVHRYSSNDWDYDYAIRSQDLRPLFEIKLWKVAFQSRSQYIEYEDVDDQENAENCYSKAPQGLEPFLICWGASLTR